jgi:hypothetical protein
MWLALSFLIMNPTLTFAQSTDVAPPECDSAPLVIEMDEAAPATRAGVWNDLYACDPVLAQDHITSTLETMLTGPAANVAISTFIGLGQSDAVGSWLEGLQSHDKNGVIGWLGEQCKVDENIANFFVAMHGTKGDAFFKERWHRGLSDCRTDAIRTLLSTEIGNRATGEVTDATGFFSILEAYARNLGAAAVPTLSALGNSQTNPEVLSYVVNAFADAANVGSVEGTNLDTADLAIAAIIELGPTLPERAVLQARTTLTTLDAEREADRFAKYRWPAQLIDGQYTYGVVALEEMVCKNGKKYAYLHHASFSEAGNMWPEQIEALLTEKLSFEWELDHAQRCKGEGEVTLTMTKEPFDGKDAKKTWFNDQFKAFKATREEHKKARVVEQSDFTM